MRIGRRAFIGSVLAGGALPLLGCGLRATRLQPTGAAYPALFDHLVWLAADLDAACARFQAMSGIAPRYGGRHPSGTHNALVALGPRCYLEIAAPQPGVTSGHPWVAAALLSPEPHLYAFCMRSEDTLEALAARAQAAGLRTLGPAPGSRMLPAGGELRWRLLIPLITGAGGAVPFFVDWLDSPHPAADAPRGAKLARLSISHPEPTRIESQLSAIAPQLRVVVSAGPALVAEIASPNGKLVLTS